MNKNDIYSHLMNGGDPQVLLDAFLKDMNDAQQKVDADKAAAEKKKKEEEAKKAAEKKVKAKREAVRKTAVEAIVNYLTLVFPNKTREELELFAKADLDATAQSIQMMESVRLSKNGNSIEVDMSELIGLLLK